jgi:sensor histidine kinase YesM
MWRKIADWYRDWENEQLAVLEKPSLAAAVQPGYRRYVANKLADLSLIERQQLREFSLNYRGRRLGIALAKLCLVFSLGGVLLHLVLPKLTWTGAIVAANMFGFSIATAVISTWFCYRKMLREWFTRFVLGISLGLLPFVLMIGIDIVMGKTPDVAVDKLIRAVPIALILTVLIAVPLMAIAALRNRQYEAITVQLQQDAERERLARELSESQLRLLRAQIEPHFLFNTLGAVQQLAEHGAPRAAELTANLIAFLRASLSEMRSERVSLAAEFGLVEAYLQVMAVRLGARLRFTLALPDALAQVSVPSMILLTLAENAIKHGIEPSLRGGEVAVSAEVIDATIRLRVWDSGVGMSITPGHGMGLDNVRHRLQLAYGEAASLTLSDAEPGLIADITIPQQ